jgi:hypothetical protein
LATFFWTDKCIFKNFEKKIVGPHFGRFFHELIWSPWLFTPRRAIWRNGFA